MMNPGGFVARFCWHLGLLRTPSEFPELVNDPWSFGILTAGIFGQFPILTLYLLKTWTTSGIDRYCRLAASLGLSTWQTRRRVAIPLLAGRGRSLFLLYFLWTLGLFEIPLLLGVQHPMMYSVLIQKRSGQFNLLQRPEAFVHATIYFVLVSFGLVLLTSRRRSNA
jgi:putative spermidine/putrescine transport system permease protein